MIMEFSTGMGFRESRDHGLPVREPEQTIDAWLRGAGFEPVEGAQIPCWFSTQPGRWFSAVLNVDGAVILAADETAHSELLLRMAPLISASVIGEIVERLRGGA